MRVKQTLILFVLVATTLGINQSVSAQFSASADFVSRYTWRGQLLASSPAIQPGISYTTQGEGKFNLEIGAWGSYAFNINDLNEADLYATASYGDFSLTFTDYFFSHNLLYNDEHEDYFDYNNHVFEIGAGWDGPISISAYYNITGDLDTNGVDLNSVYVEASYGITDEFSVILAGGSGWYSDNGKFDLVTVGCGYARDIKISEKFSLPIFANLIFNPSIGKMFIVFGLTIGT